MSHDSSTSDDGRGRPSGRARTTRRGLLTAGTLAGLALGEVGVGTGGAEAATGPGGTAGVGVAGVTTSPTVGAKVVSPPFPVVQPIWSSRLVHLFGVNTKPNALQSGYGDIGAWMSALKSTGATYFRGMYAPGLPAMRTVVAQARSHGLKWGMQVAQDINTHPSAVVASIRAIAAHAADRCLYIEGLNEPNNVRGPNVVPAGWKPKTMAIQEAIFQTVRADSRLDDALVLGPSLRDVSATTADYQSLRTLGLCENMDFAAMHRYPNGHYPSLLMDERVALLNAVWPGKPIWITEHGYTNALAATAGQLPTPEDVVAQYAPASLLEAADRNLHLTWYELLDTPDPGTKNQVEANFGLFATKGNQQGAPWRRKAVASALASFVADLRDPGPPYDPPAVPLRVTSSIPDVRHTVTGKRDGSVYVHLRRATDCWNPSTQKRVAVALARVVVSTPSLTRTLQVDHQVTTVQIK